MTFKLKHRFICDSFNPNTVVICGTCTRECIEKTGKGKTKLKNEVKIYR